MTQHPGFPSPTRGLLSLHHILPFLRLESPMPLTFGSAELVALCFESVLYGV